MPPKKKKHVNRTIKASDKELLFRDDDQMYGVAVAVLGDRRFQVVLDVPDQSGYTLAVGKLRGNMRRSDRVMCGTHVLCSGRFDAAEKVDILHRYIDAHEKLLRRYGEFQDLDAKHKKYQQDTEPGAVTGGTHVDAADDDDVVFESTDDVDLDLI